MRSEDLTVRVRCEAVRGNLARVRTITDAFLRGAPPHLYRLEDREEILLALQECMTNVIRHAYGNRPGRELEVHLTVNAREFRARIMDQGEPFDPQVASGPDANPPGDGGYGLRLVSNTMDEIRRWRTGSANWTELLRRCRAGAAGVTDRGA